MQYFLTSIATQIKVLHYLHNATLQATNAIEYQYCLRVIPNCISRPRQQLWVPLATSIVGGSHQPHHRFWGPHATSSVIGSTCHVSLWGPPAMSVVGGAQLPRQQCGVHLPRQQCGAHLPRHQFVGPTCHVSNCGSHLSF